MPTPYLMTQLDYDDILAWSEETTEQLANRHARDVAMYTIKTSSDPSSVADAMEVLCTTPSPPSVQWMSEPRRYEQLYMGQFADPDTEDRAYSQWRR